MAQKRMFSKKITDSDKFLDLPLSAQALYFHLNMHGDDDGFVDNTKTIKRMLGASDGDLRLLMDQNFIIPFESGVVVIKDWRIHNYIPRDRYKQTIYLDDFKRLTTAENGSYTECIQNVYSLDTQISIDKISIDKISISSSIEQLEADTATEKNIFDYYQSRIGAIDGYQVEELQSYLSDDHLEPELVKRAIDRAADNGKRNFGYINAIIKNWAQNDIRTIAQQDEEQRNFADSKAKKSGTLERPEYGQGYDPELGF